jgi:hypothetical protein
MTSFTLSVRKLVFFSYDADQIANVMSWLFLKSSIKRSERHRVCNVSVGGGRGSTEIVYILRPNQCANEEQASRQQHMQNLAHEFPLQPQTEDISRAAPSFSVFKPILRAFQRPFSHRDHPRPHETKNRGHRFCESFQLTNVTFWDFTRGEVDVLQGVFCRGVHCNLA